MIKFIQSNSVEDLLKNVEQIQGACLNNITKISLIYRDFW